MSGIAVAVRRTLPPPVEVFQMLRAEPGLFWLDSSLLRNPDGRYSAIGCNPRSVFEIRGREWSISGPDGVSGNGAGKSLQRLEEWLDARRSGAPELPSLPFWGGAVGFLGYDLCRQFESVPAIASPDSLNAQDVRLAWHDAAFIWDHNSGESWIVGTPWRRPAEQAIEELEQNLVGPALAPRRPEPKRHGASAGPTGHRIAFTSDLGRTEYVRRVGDVKSAIARGEVYQINLGHRFEGPVSREPWETYLSLRAANPAPFSFFQDAGAFAILGSSPERFLEIQPSGQIRTCPIKGTRPRGHSPADDDRLRESLERSPKERAELLMIVDLLRNDLGRVCETGSVSVDRLYSLESYATVHHLVAEITGWLRPDVRIESLLRAVFPGGSISGAPKVSALGVIDRLEHQRRGLFTGSMGYFSVHGRIDLNIAIRTIVCREGRASFQIGSGIVWDSDPNAEYDETLAKGRALFAALEAEMPDQSPEPRA